MDVFFYEAFKEEEEALKNFLPKNISAGFTWKTIQEQNDKLPPSTLISIRTQSIIPYEWAEQLNGILSRSTGYDHLKKYQKEIIQQVQFGYLPLYCHRAVAEQAMILWMALLRKLPQQIKNFSTFQRDNLSGYECKGKTILIVGVGNIGGQILQIAKGLEMKVLCVDIEKKYPAENYVTIRDGVKKADIIVCAMNLNETNNNYFSFELLKTCKKNTLFINIARGEFCSSSTLLRLVNEGHLGGVGLDVYQQEQRLAVSLRKGEKTDVIETLATLELSKKQNVIFTPHNAFNTFESVDRKASQSIEQVIHFLETKKFKWQIPD